jgi:hypothetical protein
MTTIFRPVPDYTDVYAGTDGSIVESGRGILTQKVGPKGYWYVYIRSAQKTIESHRLIAAAFLGIRPKGIETRHGEGGKLDNRPTNLSYGTHRENMQDAIRDGHHAAVFGKAKTHCPRQHKYTPENTYLDARGNRQCRECRKHQGKIQDAKRKQKRAEKRYARPEFKEG